MTDYEINAAIAELDERCWGPCISDRQYVYNGNGSPKRTDEPPPYLTDWNLLMPVVEQAFNGDLSIPYLCIEPSAWSLSVNLGTRRFINCGFQRAIALAMVEISNRKSS